MSDRIEKQIELKAPVSRVWRALTDHREFGQWFGVKLEAPFAVGEEARGQFANPKMSHLTLRVTVKEITPESLFSFAWHPYGIDPKIDYSAEMPTLVEFALSPIPAGTLLVVTESGFDKVPAARRAEAFTMNEKGWASQLRNIEKHVTEAADVTSVA